MDRQSNKWRIKRMLNDKKKKPLNTAQQFGLIEDVSFLVDILYDSKKKNLLSHRQYRKYYLNLIYSKNCFFFIDLNLKLFFHILFYESILFLLIYSMVFLYCLLNCLCRPSFSLVQFIYQFYSQL